MGLPGSMRLLYKFESQKVLEGIQYARVTRSPPTLRAARSREASGEAYPDLRGLRCAQERGDQQDH